MMKHAAKRTLSALLAVLMIASLLVVPAAADVAEVPISDDAPLFSGEAITLGETITEADSAAPAIPAEEELPAVLSAEGSNSHVLISDDLHADLEKNLPATMTKTPVDGKAATLLLPEGQDPVNYSYKDYFTVHFPAKGKMDANGKKFVAAGYDTFEPKTRIHFSNATKMTDKTATIEFTTMAQATVTVWWNNDKKWDSTDPTKPARFAAVYTADGTEVGSPTYTPAGNPDNGKDTNFISTFTLDNPGTYYLGNKGGNVYFYKVQVDEVDSGASVYTITTDTIVADNDGVIPTIEANTNGVKAGTKDYFTINYGKNGAIKAHKDAANALEPVTFPDKTQTKLTHYLDFGGENKKEGSGARSLQFTVTEVPAKLKVWWTPSGDNRPLKIYQGEWAEGTAGTPIWTAPSAENSSTAYYTSYVIRELGTYILTGNKPRLYQVQVQQGGTIKEDVYLDMTAANIGTPAVSKVELDPKDDAKVNVTVTGAKVGEEEDETTIKYYADKITVTMYNAAGEVVDTASGNKMGDTQTVEFYPPASGKYTFKAVAERAGETATVAGAASDAFDFLLPLGIPALASATSSGGGKVNVVWAPVKEATSYNVYYRPYTEPAAKAAEGEAAPAAPAEAAWELAANVPGVDAEATKVEYEIPAELLKIGSKFEFCVRAVRAGTGAAGSDELSEQSETKVAMVTQDAQTAWAFATFGESTSYKDNKAVGDLNLDGKVQIISANGSGKMLPASADGIAFYYTPVPADKNFTLRAKVHVDTWKNNSAQNGVGVAALDQVDLGTDVDPSTGKRIKFWNNSYLAGALKFPYYFDKDTGKAYDEDEFGRTGNKYNMYIGLAAVSRMGVPAGYTGAANPDTFFTRSYPLDVSIARDNVKGSGNKYNVIGNNVVASKDKDAFEPEGYMLTDFELEVKKNNTGYIMSYYDIKTGKLVGQDIRYYVRDGGKELMDLNIMDKENMYVGLFTARDMTATFSEVKLTVIDPEKDEPPVSPPITQIVPNLTLISGESSNTTEYTLSFSSNVDGTATVTHNKQVVAENVAMKSGVRCDVPLTLKEGRNPVVVTFQPDPDQPMPDEWTKLANTDSITKNMGVTLEMLYQDREIIYTAPNGKNTGLGTRSNPVDVYTAVSSVKPGQTIVLMTGTYKLNKEIRINRGMNGTAEKPIYFMGEPGTDCPVIDCQRVSNGIVHASDYWVFQGFDIVNSANNKAGFQLCGHHNVVKNVELHDNGGTGLQISRLSESDYKTDWPSYNLVLNCAGYRNYDAGYSDADGFGAKLTVGEGNVFDGCVAAWNADDGWDLYAKAESGQIGKVTIKNSIAYENGYDVRQLDAEGLAILNEKTGLPELDYKEDGSLNLKTAGNGNGFKMGGESIEGHHEIINSYAFNNAAKGIESNSCPDIVIRNCTSFNNKSSNIGFYTKNATQTAFVGENILSFKNDKAAGDESDNLAPVGDQAKKDSDLYKQMSNDTTYYWDKAAKKSVNASGAELTADAFVSLTYEGWAWDAETGAPVLLGDFLKKSDKAPAGAGAGDLVNDDYTTGDIIVPAEPDVPDANDPIHDTEEKPSHSGGGGGGGSVGVDKGDKPATTEPTDAPKTYTSSSKTDTEGNKTITVKADDDGEVVAQVKLPATIPAPEKEFADVPEGHWAEDSINNMAALGMVEGVSEDTYDMTSSITRGSIATILFRLSNGKTGKTNTFADVADGQWYTDAIAWAADVGVVNGYSDDTFGPNDSITRQQLAVMIARYAKLIGMDTRADSAAMAAYADKDATDTWAADSMAWAVQTGIIKGKSADTLDPTSNVTRAEAAVMLDRFIAMLMK